MGKRWFNGLFVKVNREVRVINRLGIFIDRLRKTFAGTKSAFVIS